MALVGYSDSEGSDTEPQSTALAPPKAAARTSKPAFQKVIDPTAPRKIKVDLPTVKPDTTQEHEPPTKKPRTAGTFGGFNSFLPAPKRTGEASAVKKIGLGSGVNLRTGAEPAFSRERPESSYTAPTESERVADTAPFAPPEDEPKEVKTVGNAMKFKPLSVVRKKAPKKNTSSLPSGKQLGQAVQPSEPPAPQPKPKPKVSLFSVTQEDSIPSTSDTVGEYQPLLSEPQTIAHLPEASHFSQTAPTNPDPNSLDAIADDLNLSASARRQLFGRNKDTAAAARISHFNTDEEYKANELLRAQGEAVEHRAVKAIAPGKHSLQQLVNAASTQKDALEDAWAAGKRNKAEGGSKYGW